MFKKRTIEEERKKHEDNSVEETGAAASPFLPVFVLDSRSPNCAVRVKPYSFVNGRNRRLNCQECILGDCKKNNEHVMRSYKMECVVSALTST